MGVVRQIALAILLLSFVVFVALFGRIPAFRSTPIGALHRLLLHRLPSAIKHVDERLTGGRLAASSARYGQYLFHEANPVVLICYLLLLTTAATLFLHTAWSRIPIFPHHYLIPPLLIAPYIFTYLCTSSTASHISTPAQAEAELFRYPFDYTLYHPANDCSTCRFEKPARSKHCSLCKTCVIRHDHHCVWVNNCIGLHNYKNFLGLLISLGVLLSYGAYLAWQLLAVSRAWDVAGTSRWQKLTFAINMNVQVAGVGLLAALTAPLAWGLLLYHLYLVWAGMTTNETAKWSALRGDIADGYAWIGTRRVAEPPEVGPEEQAIEWSDQIVVVMRDERHPSSLRIRSVDPKSWRELWSLRDVENVYDAGFWTNLKDALGLTEQSFI